MNETNPNNEPKAPAIIKNKTQSTSLIVKRRFKINLTKYFEFSIDAFTL
ncbi:hypothetical protein [Mycoplasma phage sp.]|uniref:Uncharacterized protein n=1 Tax=Mycoplasmopsis anatis 1340 TaxID=1034808 RepID=F9QDJ8_9BACT|nr:hypothetical protein [Mycoplasmopsis anatis]EGS29174.1 hypothetical protein GIG_02528 [Mycoplasmopsis anatis 1340]QRI43924.1 hypothetical protein [Mycoplasma phage sp.]QRI43959.1 hypothetical protein [Mycoplasma phage sp.]